MRRTYQQPFLASLALLTLLSQVTYGDLPYTQWCRSQNPRQQAWCRTARTFCSVGTPRGLAWCNGTGRGPGWTNYPTYNSLCCPRGTINTGTCTEQQARCADPRAIVGLPGRQLRQYMQDHPNLQQAGVLNWSLIMELYEAGNIVLSGSRPLWAALIASNSLQSVCIGLRLAKGTCRAMVGLAQVRCLEAFQLVYIQFGCPAATGIPW